MIVREYRIRRRDATEIVKAVHLTPDLPGPALYCAFDGTTRVAPKQGDYLVESYTKDFWFIVPQEFFKGEPL